LKTSLTTAELIEKIKDIHLIGIRSKTKLTAEVLQHATKLLAIGCFCIGTDQVDLKAAEKRGICVFNSPFANTRSVAELVMAEIVMLARKTFDKSSLMHQGKWRKSAVGCYEVRGKKLGVIGYGHVGSQVSLLAESFGMHVYFYDVIEKLPLGNAKPLDSLEQVLQTCDFVTLHVPKTPQTNNLVAKRELDMMKKGSYLLNLSRGNVVNVSDLADALKSGHIAGCAADVFPSEPEDDSDDFVSPLLQCPNTILTPHIGGSTGEAQHAIGIDVSKKMITYINEGTSTQSVNFPQLSPAVYPECHRLLHVHKNVPGVLKSINDALCVYNVSSQLLATSKDIGYLIIDIDSTVSKEVFTSLKALGSTIKVRMLY